MTPPKPQKKRKPLTDWQRAVEDAVVADPRGELNHAFLLARRAIRRDGILKTRYVRYIVREVLTLAAMCR